MNLTKEEQEIIEYVESGESKSIPNVKDEITKYTKMAKNHIRKKKAINSQF